MSVAFIGPIALDLFDCSFSWAGAPTAAGTRAASFGGTVDWAKAHQLSELCANADREVTIGGDVGVLEYVWSDDSMLRPFNGWYLLKQCTVSPAIDHSVDADQGFVPVSISAVLVGERQVAVVRSARARVNVHALAGAEVLAAPFAVSVGNDAFTPAPGGTELAREADVVHGDDLWDATPEPRDLQLWTAAVGTFADVVVPAVDVAGSPPPWLTLRGGDCRAFDVSEGRAVYGPSHPLVEPSDLVIENGVLRAWCGPRGVVPYLSVAAFVDGAWAQTGVVALAAETTGPVLESARLVAVTPDVVTAALRVRTRGEVFVSLRRGERMLRVQHGTSRSPTVSADRLVTWLGVPPTVFGAAGLISGAGVFGDGVSGAARFQWPVASTPDGWAVAGGCLPDDDDDAQPASGLWRLVDADDQNVAVLRYDDAEQRFVLEQGADEVLSAPVTFAAAAPIRFAAAYANGTLRLTVWTPNEGVSHTAAAADTPATAPVALALYEASDVDWGDDAWGDGVWGGPFGAFGILDELVVFAGNLTATQAETLVTAGSQLGGLPSDPRPVWYAAFDSDPVPAGDALGAGRRVESAADANGFSRLVAALDAVVSAGPLGVSAVAATTLEVAAGLATAAAADTAADLHDQFAAASEQETRIR